MKRVSTKVGSLVAMVREYMKNERSRIKELEEKEKLGTLEDMEGLELDIRSEQYLPHYYEEIIGIIESMRGHRLRELIGELNRRIHDPHYAVREWEADDDSEEIIVGIISAGEMARITIYDNIVFMLEEYEKEMLLAAVELSSEDFE
jgi:hypothetical protein